MKKEIEFTVTELTTVLLEEVGIYNYNGAENEAVQKRITYLLKNTLIFGKSLYDVCKDNKKKVKITKKAFLDYCGYEWYKYLKKKHESIIKNYCDNTNEDNTNENNKYKSKKIIEKNLKIMESLKNYEDTYDERMNELDEMRQENENSIIEINMNSIDDIAKKEMITKAKEYVATRGTYSLDVEQYVEDFKEYDRLMESGDLQVSILKSEQELIDKFSDISNYMKINESFCKGIFEIIKEDIKKIVKEEIEKKVKQSRKND